MSSVDAVSSAGLNYLTQLLAGSRSALAASGLSATQLQSVLKDASPKDVVQLSNQALQLQNVDALFGISNSSRTSDLSSLFYTPSSSSSSDALSNLLASLTGDSTSATDSSTSSLTSQLNSSQDLSGLQQLASLYGSGGATGSLFDLLG